MSNKRPEKPDDEENDSWIGPMPSEALQSTEVENATVPPKKRKRKGVYIIHIFN